MGEVVTGAKCYDASSYTRELKALIAARASEARCPDSLLSVFLIGSCSDAAAPPDWYQDFDIHFRFKGIALKQETLFWLSTLLEECASLQDQTCKIETFVRDRHWKMVPDTRWAGNVGIHATLLNDADHFRRVHYNPVLSQNMYVRCAVIWGQHPREMVGFRPSVPGDLAYSVGGIGWMVENFTRMAALHIMHPEDRTFYPFVTGYCWNVASTLMFHLATLEQGGVYGRQDAFNRFVRRSDTPRQTRTAAQRLYALREEPDIGRTGERDHIEATAQVVEYAAEAALALTGVVRPDEDCAALASRRPLYESEVGRAVGQDCPIGLAEALVEPGPDGFYAAVAQAIGGCAAQTSSDLCVRENFEVLRTVWASKRPLSRLRLWSRASIQRRRLSFDFSYDRGECNFQQALFGWEDGAQALLQRLHEVFIEKGGVDAELSALSEASARIVARRASDGGLAVPKKLEEPAGASFQEICDTLAELLAPHIARSS